MSGPIHLEGLVMWGNNVPECPECGRTDRVSKNDSGNEYVCSRCDEIFDKDGKKI